MKTIKLLWCDYLLQFVSEQPSEHTLASCSHRWVEIEKVA